MKMKNLKTLTVILFFTISAFSQNIEFKTYSNGLIYSEQTMSNLRHTVDSLNLQFKSCDLDVNFYAKYQTLGHLVELDSGDIESAKLDIEKNIPFEEFCAKYPQAKVEKNILIIRSKYTNSLNKELVRFEHFDLQSDYGFSVESEDPQQNLKGKWLYRYNKKTNYSNETLESFFFPENFKKTQLPKKYASMIGYSECLIDTTTSKFKENSKPGWVNLPENWAEFSNKKKESLLEEMRSTIVIGGCSQDRSPRDHAINIALLSAETNSWKVFLKAHLDIMNDRFERVSDGSYAWNDRKTYIKELEELNINVIDLILGISFRIEDPSTNHYFGNIGRLGRALSETSNRAEFENTILSIIMDKELDHYNRLLFYYLFINYNYYIEDKVIKKVNNEKLTNAVASLPENFIHQLVND